MRWFVLIVATTLSYQSSIAPDRIRAVNAEVSDSFWRARLDGKPAIKLPFVLDAAYLDVIELALYNGVLSTLSIKDNLVLYDHPLSLDQKTKHSVDLSCCPGSADTQVEPSGLIYGQSNDTLFVGLFAASEAQLQLTGTRVRVTQRTRYPWDGEFEMRVEPDAPTTFNVAIRIPAWTRGAPVAGDRYRFHDPDIPAPTLLVNGQTVRVKIDRGFARFSREWRRGDVLHLYFPMRIQRVLSVSTDADNRARAAIQRGPLVYAFAPADASLPTVTLPLEAELTDSYRQDVAGGAVVINGPGVVGMPYYARPNRTIESVWLRH